MHVRPGIRIQPIYEHDCSHCVLISHHFGQGEKDKLEDVYLCVPSGGGMGSLIHRHSSEPSDYSSTPIAIEGEPDPTRRRLDFGSIRTIEHALSLAAAVCRAVEEEQRDPEDMDEDDLFHVLIDRLGFASYLLDPATLTEEKIRRVAYHFDTDVERRWPVIYTPHEHTPAPEET